MTPASDSPSDPGARTGKTLFELSIGVFFLGGFLTSIVGLLVPRLTLTLGLDYTRALLVQFAFHLSYLLFAFPIAIAILRIGYMRSIVVGLSVMLAGCLVLIASAEWRSFVLVLLALLTLSTGITFLQIAANTVVTVVGPSRRAAARLTLLQGFNSLGTVLGPLIGAVFLLGSIGIGRAGPAGDDAVPFIAGAILLGLLAIAFYRQRNLLGKAALTPAGAVLGDLSVVLRDRRLLAGAVAMFAYVGAEVAIGTLIPNFLMLPEILHSPPLAAGQLVSLYWGGAMIGRFAGALLLRRIDAGLLLAVAGIGAMVLAVIASLAGGVTGAVALIAVGLCNSIMYPTLYALALPEDEAQAPLASMLLCMAVVGGAIVPLLTGVLADRIGLALSLLLPASCYLVIAGFAAGNRKSANPVAMAA
ncbi:MFS transporter [Sphingomonas sp. ERG5]|uniref:MFS transporter n=1 Tax=Sphingomonas sp. ERG5 TaxID=1381597 RepID=UPI00054BC436|nr:MFS transporter [Sphingomonas sp. ERG5]